MASHFSLSVILILLDSSSTLMVKVASDRCKEYFGGCKNDCNNRCSSAHKGGVGICEPGGGGQLGCWCYYDCPPLKTCSEDFLLRLDCTDQDCDIVCGARHPGHGAKGRCIYDPSLADAVCHCTYYCNPPATTKFVP